MKSMTFIFLILFSLTIIKAQEPPSNPTPPLYTEEDLRQLGTIGPMSPGARTIDTRYEGVKGSPFLFEDWTSAALQLKDKEDFGNEVSINIDGEKNHLYFQLPGGYDGMIPAERLQAIKVKIAPEKYQIYEVWSSKEVEGEKEPILKYYESLYDDKFKLLKLDYRYFVKADYKGPYSSDRRYDEYIADSSLWLKEEGGSFHKIKLKRKSIEQALPSYASDIQKVMKQHKIILQSENDLIALLKLL